LDARNKSGPDKYEPESFDSLFQKHLWARSFPGAPVIKPQFSEARSFVGKLARVTLGMSEDEALLKALKDHEAGKPRDQIERELEKNKGQPAFIDRTGKIVWKQPN
jgi:hypothetical protein